MNNITVTISNYKGKKITYTIPEDDTINVWTVQTFQDDKGYFLSNANIEIYGRNGIEGTFFLSWCTISSGIQIPSGQGTPFVPAVHKGSTCKQKALKGNKNWQP